MFTKMDVKLIQNKIKINRKYLMIAMLIGIF